MLIPLSHLPRASEKSRARARDRAHLIAATELLNPAPGARPPGETMSAVSGCVACTSTWFTTDVASYAKDPPVRAEARAGAGAGGGGGGGGGGGALRGTAIFQGPYAPEDPPPLNHATTSRCEASGACPDIASSLRIIH